MSDNPGIDEVDLCTMTLLKELADLDAMENNSSAEKDQLAASALKLVERLETLGGGSIGSEKLAAIGAQLKVVLKRQ